MACWCLCRPVGRARAQPGRTVYGGSGCWRRESLCRVQAAPYGQMMSAASSAGVVSSHTRLSRPNAVECASVLQHASPAILLAVAARVKYASARLTDAKGCIRRPPGCSLASSFSPRAPQPECGLAGLSSQNARRGAALVCGGRSHYATAASARAITQKAASRARAEHHGRLVQARQAQGDAEGGQEGHRLIQRPRCCGAFTPSTRLVSISP